MADYLARRIIEGKLIYSKLFQIEKWKKYQDETDELLIQKEYENLIKR